MVKQMIEYEEEKLRGERSPRTTVVTAEEPALRLLRILDGLHGESATVEDLTGQLGLSDGRALGALQRTITQRLVPFGLDASQVVHQLRRSGRRYWRGGPRLSEAIKFLTQGAVQVQAGPATTNFNVDVIPAKVRRDGGTP